MKYAAKVDANHSEVIRTFRDFGFSVADTSRLGGGFPDCVIARGLKTAVVEIKDGKKVPSARKLTADEERFKNEWRGRWCLVESIDDVLAIAENW